MISHPSIRRKQTVPDTFFMPPPTGWNARDDQYVVDHSHALRLENFIVRPDGIHMRKGWQVQGHGMGAPVDTLIPYEGAQPRLFAATKRRVWDVSNKGNSAELDAGVNSENGDWSWAPLSNGAGQFVGIANGTCPVHVFDGSAWSAVTFTNDGHDITGLDSICEHQRRWFFLKRNTLQIFYLPMNAIQGPIECLDLAPLFRHGGSLQSIGVMRNGAGRSTDDMICFMTSEGEYAIFAGLIPDRADDWNVVAIDRAAAPMGYRALTEVGGDLCAMTREGFMSISKNTNLQDSVQFRTTKSDIVQPALKLAYESHGYEDLRLYESRAEGAMIAAMPSVWEDDDRWKWHEINHGMMPAPWRKPRQAISDISQQFVIEGETGGHSSWHGLQARCWCDWQGKLYFGRNDGKVGLYAGYMDDDKPRSAFLCQGYSDFRRRETKTVKRVLHRFQKQPTYRPRVQFLSDHQRVPAELPTSFTNDPWEEMTAAGVDWATPQTRYLDRWSGASGKGRHLAMMLGLSATTDVVYCGTDVIFGRGGII